MTIRSLARDLLPPAVVRALRRKPLPPTPDFAGDYTQWSHAQIRCSGYDAPDILEKTRQATLKVHRDEAAFERDSVVFQTLEHPFPLLSGLSRAAAADQGKLSVIDFGGALGSTYFQVRKFLSGLSLLQWSVVEQPAHVACGNADLASDQLRFYLTCAECVRAQQPNVLLVSGVLQYMPEPYRTLDELCALGIANLIIDRTAFLPRDQDRLTIQTVPDFIYRASYPAWFFNEARFLDRLQRQGYHVLADFPGFDHLLLEGSESYFKGFICVKT